MERGCQQNDRVSPAARWCQVLHPGWDRASQEVVRQVEVCEHREVRHVDLRRGPRGERRCLSREGGGTREAKGSALAAEAGWNACRYRVELAGQVVIRQVEHLQQVAARNLRRDGPGDQVVLEVEVPAPPRNSNLRCQA